MIVGISIYRFYEIIMTIIGKKKKRQIITKSWKTCRDPFLFFWGGAGEWENKKHAYHTSSHSSQSTKARGVLTRKMDQRLGMIMLIIKRLLWVHRSKKRNPCTKRLKSGLFFLVNLKWVIYS